MARARGRSRRDFTGKRYIEPATAALIGGGLAAGAAGGIATGSAANRAARKSRDFFDKRTQEAMNRLFGSFLGPEGASNLFNSLTQGGGEGAPGAQAAFQSQIGGPIFGQLQGAGRQAQFGFGEQRRMLDELFRGQNELAFAAPGQIQNLFRSAAGPIEANIGRFGRGRESQIREDAALSLKDLNQATRASTAGLGANTLTSAGLRGNAREIERGKQRSLTDLGDAQSRLFASALSPFLFGGAQGAAGAQLSAIERLFGQAMASSQLGERNVGRAFDLQTGPLQQLLSLTQQPIANPFLGVGPPPSGGASGLGNALGTTGNLLTALGGSQL